MYVFLSRAVWWASGSVHGGAVTLALQSRSMLVLGGGDCSSAMLQTPAYQMPSLLQSSRVAALGGTKTRKTYFLELRKAKQIFSVALKLNSHKTEKLGLLVPHKLNLPVCPSGSSREMQCSRFSSSWRAGPMLYGALSRI